MCYRNCFQIFICFFCSNSVTCFSKCLFFLHRCVEALTELDLIHRLHFCIFIFCEHREKQSFGTLLFMVFKLRNEIRPEVSSGYSKVLTKRKKRNVSVCSNCFCNVWRCHFEADI